MFNKSYNVAATEKANIEVTNTFTKYNVKLLDESVEIFSLSAHARGMHLLDAVCDSLELMERDYFGIQYKFDDSRDNPLCWKWIKIDKLIRKQMKGDISTKVFYLRVRFVPSEVYQMQETYTRYQLFMQIKQDVATSKINCPREIAIQLAGFALQSELGDHNASILKQGYVGEFRFIPEQTPSFEAEVANFHKSLRGIRAEDAELKFLTTAKQLFQYGCDLYNCEIMEKPIQFGLHAIGISIFSQESNGSFIIPWNAVDKVSNKNKLFKIKVLDSQPLVSLTEGGATNSVQVGKKANLSMFDHLKSSFNFLFVSNEEAKEAWRSCIDNHSFFRIRDPKQIQNSAMIKRSHSLFKFMAVRTLFTGRRTLPELQDIKRRNKTMERSFIRTPSKRYVRKHPGQSEKQSIISVTESIRPSGPIQSKKSKSAQSSISVVAKEKSKTDTKIESINRENEIPEASQPETVHYRPKSQITANVRLDKSSASRESEIVSTAHSTLSRKPRNIYSKSLSVDDSRKILDPNSNEVLPKSTNPTKNYTNQRPSSTAHDSKTHSKSKVPDLDHAVEITIRAQDGKYGFTIRGGSDIGGQVTVSKVTLGSTADNCVPRLSEGDQIIRINNKLAEELRNDEIKEIIRNTGQRKDSQLVLLIKSRSHQ